jgi:hypothetical protein
VHVVDEVEQLGQPAVVGVAHRDDADLGDGIVVAVDGRDDRDERDVDLQARHAEPGRQPQQRRRHVRHRRARGHHGVAGTQDQVQHLPLFFRRQPALLPADRQRLGRRPLGPDHAAGALAERALGALVGGHDPTVRTSRRLVL